MPLAFAALLGGLTTLIGTPPNILISEALQDAGLRPFTMFDFAPVGMAVLLAGTIFMALIGRRLAAQPRYCPRVPGPGEGFQIHYDLQERMVVLHLPPGSILDGKTLAESRLGSVLGLNVMAVFRGQTQLSPGPGFLLQDDDRLLVEGRLDRLFEIHGNHLLHAGRRVHSMSAWFRLKSNWLRPGCHPDRISLARPCARSASATIIDVIVLAIRRGGVVMRTNLENIPLLTDDVLLLQGERTHSKN